MAAATETDQHNGCESEVGEAFPSLEPWHIKMIVATYIVILRILGLSADTISLKVSEEQEEDTMAMSGGVLWTNNGSRFVVFKATLSENIQLTYHYCIGSSFCVHDTSEEPHEFDSDRIALCVDGVVIHGSKETPVKGGLGSIGEEEDEDAEDEQHFFDRCGQLCFNDFCDEGEKSTFIQTLRSIYKKLPRDFVKAASRSSE